MRNGRALSVFFLLLPLASFAAEISLVGLYAGKAVITVDRGRPRTLSVGESAADGVKLVAADNDSAVVEYRGLRQTLRIGQGTRVSTVSSSGSGRVVLTADERGHYITTGMINGNSVRFLVDTGATAIVLSTAQAQRLGLDYRRGARTYNQTANGLVPVYRVTLDTVQVGELRLDSVEAVVSEGSNLPLTLLGMSFLNRTDMKQDGTSLVLTKRY